MWKISWVWSQIQFYYSFLTCRTFCKQIILYTFHTSVHSVLYLASADSIWSRVKGQKHYQTVCCDKSACQSGKKGAAFLKLSETDTTSQSRCGLNCYSNVAVKLSESGRSWSFQRPVQQHFTVWFHCVGIDGSLIVLVFVMSLLYDFRKTSKNKRLSTQKRSCGRVKTHMYCIVLADRPHGSWKCIFLRTGIRVEKSEIAALPFSCGRRIRILSKTMTPSPHPAEPRNVS